MGKNRKLIVEVGIIFNGIQLISKSFNGYSCVFKDKMLKSGFYSAIHEFNRKLYSQDLKILGGKDFLTVFHIEDFGYLKSSNLTLNKDKYFRKKEYFLGFVVIKNHQKRMKRFIVKKVIPELKRTLLKFKLKYFSCNFNDLSQFREFKEVIKSNFSYL